LIIINSDRYSTNLQKTVEEASFIDGPSILIAAAEQVTAEQLRGYFSERDDLTTPTARLRSAAALFESFGFGDIDFGKVSPNGGRVTLKDSYFAQSWNAQFGRRATPGCHFATGYIAGAMAAAFSKHTGGYSVQERRCISSGARQCEFDVEVK
jgi:hypothetical protein